VEDDYAVRDSTMKGLANHGFDVLESASGDEALRLVQNTKETIGVAVIDMAMPLMWGDELARRLAIISPETKFIYISGHSEDFLLSGGALAENDIFFAKPFSPKLLLEKIRELLGMEIPIAAVAPAVDATSGLVGDPQHPYPCFTECQDIHVETDQHVD